MLGIGPPGPVHGPTLGRRVRGRARAAQPIWRRGPLERRAASNATLFNLKLCV